MAKTSRDALAECMHTALRKFCDSKESHHLWHLLHAIDNQSLCIFYDAIYESVHDMPDGMPLPEFAVQIKKAVESIEIEMNPYTYDGVQALKSGCNLLSANDWQGFVGYVNK